jgi:hypothetical protein
VLKSRPRFWPSSLIAFLISAERPCALVSPLVGSELCELTRVVIRLKLLVNHLI